jgi:transketolase
MLPPPLHRPAENAIPVMLTQDELRRARKRLLQMHFESKVGHIGGNLSALDAMLVVFREFLQREDRFVLSKGHSAGALYTSLWSMGLLSDADLQTFHQDGTLLAGHPPTHGMPSVSFATGSLGHGLSLAAGTALGFALRGQKHRVYCITSDGEWQEGSTWEALIFAAHHRLSNLTVLIDHNRLQGFGTTEDVASMSPLAPKLRGFDVALVTVDGHDVRAIREAVATRHDGPTIILLETIKGHGVSFLENRMDSHYLPLSKEQFELALAEIDRA